MKSKVKKRGIIHAFKGGNNCSLRTQLAARLMDKKLLQLSNTTSNKERNMNDNAMNNITPGFNRRFCQTLRSKRKTLEKIPDVFPRNTGIHVEKLTKYLHFFTTKTKTDFLVDNNDYLSHVKNKFKIKTFIKDMVVDTKLGCKLMESQNVPVFILVPRIQIVTNWGSAHLDVNSLGSLLNTFNKNTQRGQKCFGLSTQYATLGAHCKRYGKGFSFTNIDKQYLDEYTYIRKKMLQRVLSLAKQFLPTGMLSQLQVIKATVKDTVSLNDDDAFNSVWASLATSFNYTSPAHVDKDAFVSCLLCSYVPKKLRNREKYYYSMDEEIACHFMFPEYGIAIALRPGDVLFFNPLHYHCLSERNILYADEKVFVTSFYLKAAQIGLNDNDIGLSESDTKFL